MANLWVSEAAAQKFRDLFAPGYTFDRALRELKMLCEQARKTDDRARGGEEIWRCGTDGEVALIVRVNRKHGQLPTVVTVVRGETREWEVGS